MHITFFIDFGLRWAGLAWRRILEINKSHQKDIPDQPSGEKKKISKSRLFFHLLLKKVIPHFWSMSSVLDYAHANHDAAFVDGVVKLVVYSSI